MEIGRDNAYERARDRAYEAVSVANGIEDARACWRLAKAHNRAMKDRRGARTGISAPLLAAERGLSGW